MITLNKLQSVEIDGMGRFYKSRNKDLWYPSVTTVTGWSKRSFFAEWRKDPNNAKKLDLAGKRGTALHGIIEDYLKSGSVNSSDPDILVLFDSIKPYIDGITDVQAQEQPLCSDTIRMAGRFDCIAKYNDRISVIDFKTSDKPKKEDWIQNYFEQASAYALMWYEETGQLIDQIVILIACADGTVQEFIKDPSLYYSPLRNSAASYWSDNNFDKLQERVREHFQETV